MLRNFQEVLDKAKNYGIVTVSVAVAQDREVIKALKLAYDSGLIRAILVGDAAAIKPMVFEAGLPENMVILDEKDDKKAALAAVELVHQGKAQVLMKGLVNTADFLKAVLHGDVGLRTGRLLSHLAAFEVPGEAKLIFHSDGGMNIAPSVGEKKEILINAMLALQALGVEEPKVAVLTANENVSPKMPATTDAKRLAEMAVEGALPAGIVEGPISLDVAVSPEAASHKGIVSKISGRVDLFLMPNIETGNVVSKALIYYAKSKMAGIVLGATHPIVLTSRAETPEGKLYSIALACLVASRQKGGEKACPK